MRILFKFFIISVSFCTLNTSCSQKNESVKEENQERLIEIEAKQNLIKTILQDSSFMVKSGINKSYHISEITGDLFLYMSDNNCLTCLESILEQTKKHIEKKKEFHLVIIYSSSILGNYYSLKNRIKADNISLFYTENIPSLIKELNEIFFFTMTSHKNINNVYIPYENKLKLDDYFSRVSF